MALSILRSCIKSRLTIGVSRQLIVLESKVTCGESHAPGAEFLMTVASKIRAFASLTPRTRTRFNTLNASVTQAFKLGSNIISLEMIDDEKNHSSMLCHMNGTTVRSNIIVSHDKYKDDNFLQAVKCIDSQVKLGERYRRDKKVKLLTSNSNNFQDTRTQSSNHSESEVALGQSHCAEIIPDVYRFDGRSIHQIRPVHCEAGYLHGSSLMSCGETQVLCTATLGKPGETQSLGVLPIKIFRVDYVFPPFCTNHVVDIFSRRWREISDGAFIEKALLAVIPSQKDFPYAIHLNSTVLASDGSSSTTSVCSIALMDAGVPIKSHVAGVSIGLVPDDETSSSCQLENYRIITDTSGLENDLGEMDFKIAGTRKGITAIQLDVKSTLLSLDVISEAIKYGRQAHLQILDHMELAINSPKETSY
ncbi:hypothetical protein N665_4195s0001 [Sinapis alba]|nr:hypothetical protein N665_4195s0001 [Sinapis alba]